MRSGAHTQPTGSRIAHTASEAQLKPHLCVQLNEAVPGYCRCCIIVAGLTDPPTFPARNPAGIFRCSLHDAEAEHIHANAQVSLAPTGMERGQICIRAPHAAAQPLASHTSPWLLRMLRPQLCSPSRGSCLHPRRLRQHEHLHLACPFPHLDSLPAG